MRKFGIIANLRDNSDIPWVFPEHKDGEELPGYKIWSRFDAGGAEGFIIILGLTGAQIMGKNRRRVRQQILDTIVFCQKKYGIEYFGLTSLTSSVTNKGLWLTNGDCEGLITASLTHGDSYAAGVGVEGLELIAKKMGKDSLSELKVAIVGASGLIGEAMTRRLIEKEVELILVGHTKANLDRLLNNLPHHRLSDVFPTFDYNDISSADIIVTATSSADSLIKPEHVKDNGPVVIYEVSVPPNVSVYDLAELQRQRPNLLKVDGSLVRIPGVKLGIQIAGIPNGVTFACWAETMMQCLEGDRADHVGKIDMSYLNETMIRGRKYDFLHAPFTCFGGPVPDISFVDQHQLLVGIA